MDGNAQIDEMFGRNEFDYAKPENLIKSILDVATEEGDLVMDFSWALVRLVLLLIK